MASGDLTATIRKFGDKPCAFFDGVDDVATLVDTSGTYGPILRSVSFWICVKATDDMDIIRKWNTTGNQRSWLILIVSNKIRVTQSPDGTNTGTVSQNSTTSVNDGSWHHVLYTYDGTNMKLYIDNVLEDTDAIASAYAGTATLTIGSDFGTANDFEGAIADIKIWEKELSSAERTTNYNGSLISDKLVGWWKLKDDYNGYAGKKEALTNSGSYLTNIDFNKIVANINALNLAATTDKFIIVPRIGRNKEFITIGVNRTA